jgi:hypothetical protein
LLLQYAEPDEKQRKLLEGLANQPIRSVRGAEIGVLRAVAP